MTASSFSTVACSVERAPTATNRAELRSHRTFGAVRTIKMPLMLAAAVLYPDTRQL
jgi:hypothetical protein